MAGRSPGQTEVYFARKIIELDSRCFFPASHVWFVVGQFFGWYLMYFAHGSKVCITNILYTVCLWKLVRLTTCWVSQGVAQHNVTDVTYWPIKNGLSAFHCRRCAAYEPVNFTGQFPCSSKCGSALCESKGLTCSVQAVTLRPLCTGTEFSQWAKKC